MLFRCRLALYEQISWHPNALCRDLDGEADVALRSCRAPGTIGMRQLFFIEEIYFAMSKIRLFPVSRSLLQGSVGQRARQAPHAPPGRFLGARVAPESSTVVTPQVPATPPALRATIPVRVRGACL